MRSTWINGANVVFPGEDARVQSVLFDREIVSVLSANATHRRPRQRLSRVGGADAHSRGWWIFTIMALGVTSMSRARRTRRRREARADLRHHHGAPHALSCHGTRHAAAASLARQALPRIRGVHVPGFIWRGRSWRWRWRGHARCREMLAFSMS